VPVIASFASGSIRGFGQFRRRGVAAGPDFNISPAVSGKTTWSMSADGNLDLSSHGEWTITPIQDFTVTVKMWGGGGASGYAYTSSSTFTETARMGAGGGGGYTTATFKFLSGSTYILRVGQGGSRSQTAAGGATYVAGGVGSSLGGAQGAGYSGIFKTSVSQANAILMAGGGGGGADTAYGTTGGAGGGDTAGDSGAGFQGGGGGTQSAGGAASIYNSATAGSALTGGVAQNGHTGQNGGGGGGYFGGGGGNVGGGGGGSGRIGSGFSEIVSGASTTTGSGATPGNNSDSDRGSAGTGSSTIDKGSDGKILLKTI
jgi:hypothetical protein